MVSSIKVEPHSWWASLKHGGLLIAPSRIAEYFPDGLAPLPCTVEHRLRADLTRLEMEDGNAVAGLLDTVLQELLGLGRAYQPQTGSWLKGNDVPAEWTHRALTGEAVKPRRVWLGPHGSALPVFVDNEPRLGVGRGRRSAARVVEWLRRADRRVALLTNGRQWRIVYAGFDHDAYAEAESALWFEEGTIGAQVTALRELLSPDSLAPVAESKPSRLLAAIEATRKGQAELSSVLGERVRQAVELLIREFSPSLEALVSQDKKVTPRHLYLAATRVVMRMVVVLFAEARDLLPRDNPIYHSSYGLSGLREILDRAAGGAGMDRLRRWPSAWPRVLALFRLVSEGSPHEALPVLRYGGGLFERGSSASTDPILRALAVFEDPEHAPSDAVIYQVLQLITRSRVKIRQGRVATWIEAPVDFSDLSSEYIGILYEGLLDFELRRAPEADPIVFLALGDEPALPLSRLESMEAARISTLLEKFKQKKRISLPEVEEETEEEADETEYEEGDEPAEEAAEDAVDFGTEGAIPLETETGVEDDRRQAASQRARTWARQAVILGKIVSRPRAKNQEALRAYEAEVEQASQALISRVVLPGEWFLVRFGGTRKGSGTFYTRPQLAVPTTQRTLRPLAYDPPLKDDGKRDENAPPSAWVPKLPEQILGLKVCDPACGSGSFLVASLRFLTNALFESLHHHSRIQAQGERTLVTLAEGKPGGRRLDEELLPCRPDAEDFEPRLRARLKRYVVERCIYGVDLDPLAVELGRLSLWVETMDRSLPFSFLDHKVKCGNSLVGCWFDRFRDYPVLAWEREGGDKGHTRGVHFEKEAWTKAIKKFRNERVKPLQADWIRGQGLLFEGAGGKTPEALHDEALAVLEEMHSLPVHETEERTTFYREKILGNPSLAQLKEAFDTWCALWFWPADQLEIAPLPINFADSPVSTRSMVEEIRQDLRFFHWELEFPDVFARPDSGFDAVVGNPPWEIQKPNSREFFSNLDPLYRTYGKQEALGKQEEIFRQGRDDERAWLLYTSRLKALSNFNKHAGSPFGDGTRDGAKFSFGAGSDRFHEVWRARRAGRKSYADSAHPYLWQGSADINTYKMFLEVSHALLRDGGQMGLLVPSGVYTDKGTTDLRRLFLTQCQWRWLFGIINWNKIFESIYYRFKFCIAIIQKGGTSSNIRSAFSRYHIEEWEEAERHVVPYSRGQVERFSPKTRAILEIRERRDLEVLEKIYANSVLLGDDSEGGWEIQYATEFHMTNDSQLFPPRPKWEADGYKPDEYGRWIKGDWQQRKPASPAPPDAPRWQIDSGIILSRDGSEWIREPQNEYIALPLYEGRMIGQFDFSEKGWVNGKGRRAEWRSIEFSAKEIEPQYLMAQQTFLQNRLITGHKIGFLAIGSATNARSMVSSALPEVPCGNSVAVLKTAQGELESLTLIANLNSYAYDFALRCRLGGLNLNHFVVEETPALRPRCQDVSDHLPLMAAGLSWPNVLYAADWIAISRRFSAHTDQHWRKYWAVTVTERLRLRCIFDAVISELYNLDWDDLGWIFRNCDQPIEVLRDKAFYRTLDPKGFWRVDKDKDPELRHTILVLAAFRDLKDTIAACGGDRDKGIERFCAQNGGEGWMLPENLCLADLGLGHYERAKKPQAVRSRLGERFFPWQLDQSVEDSWRECELHARNILGAEAFARLQGDLRERRVEYTKEEEALPRVAETQNTSLSDKGGVQGGLFPMDSAAAADDPRKDAQTRKKG